MTINDKSRAQWLDIHNQSAGVYRNTEWSREVLFGARKMRRKLFARARGKVLDVACGYGMNFPHLTDAEHITGVDFSPVMLGYAREYTRKLGLNVDLKQGDAEALDFPDNSFDTVVSALSTCSFYNPLTALQEIKRVCKPDGQILLIEHGRSSWEWLGRYQDRHVHQMTEQGGCRWNQEPQELIKQAGLQIVHAERTLLGIFHTITVSPAKIN